MEAVQYQAQETLYQKFGGEGTIKAVVEDFYKRVLANPALRSYFARADMARLKRHQALFISQALGGPKQYDGRDMKSAHRGMNITADHFDQVVGHLVDSLRSFGVDWPSVDQVIKTVAPLKSSIVEA